LDAGGEDIPTTIAGKDRQTEYTKALPPAMSHATPPLPPRGEATPTQPDVASGDAYRAVCKTTKFHGLADPIFTATLFGAGVTVILDLEQAVQARKDALRTGNDPLMVVIQKTQESISRLEKDHRDQPTDLNNPPDQECFKRYLAFLESVDAPSWVIARKAAEQDSAARIEEQRRVLEAKERAAAEVAAEQARRQKEAEVIKAQMDENRKQREAAAAVAQRKDAEAAAAKEEWERPAREAAAKAAQNAADALKREAEKLPACADNNIIKSVKEIVAASPAGVTQGLRISGLEEISSVRLDTEPAKRFCSAKMMTTAGTINGVYTIRWTEAHDNVWVEILGVN